ncbi:MAG: ABC transporter permease [Terriglobales bacterium]
MKHFDAVSAIAVNTFRETVRDRIIYAFILFAFAITIIASLLGSLSVGQDVRILEDIGLTAISLIGGALAVFAGTNLVYKELERRTVYIIFTKPVTGWQFITGKYIGLSLCILMIVTAMGLFLAILLSLTQAQNIADVLNRICEPLALVYMELLFVIAAATFFSTFASPMMSVLFTLSLWLIGHFSDSFKSLGQLSQSPIFQSFTDAVYMLIPDLATLTKTRAVLMYGQHPQTELLSFITCYVCGYVLLLLVLASLVTEQREFP